MTVRNEEKKPFRDLTLEERSEIVNVLASGGIVDMIFGDSFQPIRNPGSISMSGIYRTNQRKLKIPWHVIKPEYKWAAMDDGGDIVVFTHEPTEEDCGWCGIEVGHGAYIIALNIDTTGIDWRESLTVRPEGV